MIEGAETIRKIDAEKNSIEIESGTSILASIDPWFSATCQKSLPAWLRLLSQ